MALVTPYCGILSAPSYHRLALSHDRAWSWCWYQESYVRELRPVGVSTPAGNQPYRTTGKIIVYFHPCVHSTFSMVLVSQLLIYKALKHRKLSYIYVYDYIIY
jgi:hypothetical protein